MNDGSKKFAEFPEIVFFDTLRDHALKLQGGKVKAFLTDWVTEVWLDFEFRKHSFSVNNPMGDYWFFVEDSNCPQEILFEVINHFSKLFEK